MVKNSKPQAEGLIGRGWTLKKLKRWVEEKLGRTVSKTTLRLLLKGSGLSWKKSKKVLAKADPLKRAAYIDQFLGWFERVCAGEIRLIYVDEVHLHQDLDLGYRWSLKGQDDWVASPCPSLQYRLNWYGAYNFSTGQCFIWHNGPCNSHNTIKFLQELAHWGQDKEQETVIIWDGASYHSRAHNVRQAAKHLGFTLVSLPAYSPDLNPIEGLWKWMREDVLQNHCYQYLYQLEYACLQFIDRINLDPDALITRLWPKFELDPEYEKVLVSF